MPENLLIQTPGRIAPELVNEVRVSNRLLRVEGKIREVIDFLRMHENEHPAIDTAIEKLEQI